MSTLKITALVSISVVGLAIGGVSIAGYSKLGSGDCNYSKETSCKNALLNEVKLKCGAEGSSKYKAFVKAGKKNGVFYWDKKAKHVEIKKGSEYKVKSLIDKKC